MAEKNCFQGTVEALMKGMDGFVSSKTIVGEPIVIGDTTLLPLSDISFGMGAGAFLGEKKKNSAGGVGGKVTPSAVLVIQNDTVRLMSLKSQDNITKILDMIPDYVNKFIKMVEARKNPEEAAIKEEATQEAAKDLKQKLHVEE